MPLHHKKANRSTRKHSSKKPRGRKGKKSIKQKGGSVLSSPTPLVGYPMEGGQPGTWPGAASAALWDSIPRLETHGMTMSNHWGLSPNGVPAGGLELPIPSNAVNKQCGGRGKKTGKKGKANNKRKTRSSAMRKRFHQKGGFSPEELITAPFSYLKNAASNAISAIKGTPPYPSSSPLSQPIGKTTHFASFGVVDVPAALNEAASEVVGLHSSHGEAVPHSGQEAHSGEAGHAGEAAHAGEAPSAEVVTQSE